NLPVWIKIPLSPPPWAVIVILVILTVVSYFLSTPKPIRGFVWLKKRLGQAVLAIAVVTSFTFFSNETIVKPKSHEAYNRLLALYRTSKKHEYESIARSLALKSLTQAVKEASADVRTYYQRLFRGIDCESHRSDCLTSKYQMIIITDYVNYR